MSDDRTQLNKLLRLRKRAQDAGMDRSPEDRAVYRALLDRIASLYAKIAGK